MNWVAWWLVVGWGVVASSLLGKYGRRFGARLQESNGPLSRAPLGVQVGILWLVAAIYAAAWPFAVFLIARGFVGAFRK